MIRLFLGALTFTILFLLFLLLVRVHTEPRRLILELRTPAEWLELLTGKGSVGSPVKVLRNPPEPPKSRSSRESVRSILEERREREELEDKDRRELERILDEKNP